MLTAEQKSRLDPEQLAIAEKWESDSATRLEYCDQMSAAQAAGDTAAYQKAFEDYLEDYLSVNKGETHCAHERSLWYNCAGCDEISRLLHPEMYCSKCEESLTENDEQPLVQGICDYCSQDE